MCKKKKKKKSLSIQIEMIKMNKEKIWGLPSGPVCKESSSQCRRHRFDP